MALTIPTQDLINYPGNVKNISVDQSAVVPFGYEGDEQYVLSFYTTAYSDNTNRTAIPRLYITETKTGWCKSSGFKGDGSGKFALSASAYKLKVKLDATVSGTDGSGYYEIDLSYNVDGTPISGEAVADDIETKIRAITLNSADTGFTMAYKNCTVEFMNNKFWVVSGSIGRYYDGANRSSVSIIAGDTNSADVILGFDLPVTSETLAGVRIKEAALASSYSAGASSITVNAGLIVSVGDALVITDGTNTDYFTALSGSTNEVINVPVSGTNGFNAITNSYTADQAKVQVLRYQDPENQPNPYYTSVDAIVRQGVKYLMSQIDYSS